jgi:hypothetical protein
MPLGLSAQDPAATDFAIYQPDYPQNQSAFAPFFPQVPGPIHSGAQAPSVNAQRIGHPQGDCIAYRAINKVEDKLDRCPCCGYGKTHNDMGVPGAYASKAFYFGGSCEFFSEPCRVPQRPPVEGNCLERFWHRVTMQDYKTHVKDKCATCGK